jgi:hypothetical protein
MAMPASQFSSIPALLKCKPEVLLVRSGQLQARLLHGIPAQFAGGVCKVKEARLEGDVLPEVFFSAPESSRVESPMPEYASEYEPDRVSHRDA